MSYARFSHADVYVYMDVNGSLACCDCSIGDQWYFDSTDEMVVHLAEHRAAGDYVPDGIEESLREDDAENFPPSCTEGHAWGEPFRPFPDHRLAVAARMQRVKCIDCDWTTSFPPLLPTRKAGAR